jgi:hypothetical protein
LPDQRAASPNVKVKSLVEKTWVRPPALAMSRSLTCIRSLFTTRAEASPSGHLALIEEAGWKAEWTIYATALDPRIDSKRTQLKVATALGALVPCRHTTGTLRPRKNPSKPFSQVEAPPMRPPPPPNTAVRRGIGDR